MSYHSTDSTVRKVCGEVRHISGTIACYALQELTSGFFRPKFPKQKIPLRGILPDEIHTNSTYEIKTVRKCAQCRNEGTNMACHEDFFRLNCYYLSRS